VLCKMIHVHPLPTVLAAKVTAMADITPP
jgi:hypothetical protein